MELCRSLFLGILYSVMTRPLRCVVASGGRVFAHPAAAHIGLLFAPKINTKKKGPRETAAAPQATDSMEGTHESRQPGRLTQTTPTGRFCIAQSTESTVRRGHY